MRHDGPKMETNHIKNNIMTLEIHIMITQYNQQIPNNSKQSMFINVQDGELELVHLAHWHEEKDDGKPNGHALVCAPFYLKGKLISHGFVHLWPLSGCHGAQNPPLVVLDIVHDHYRFVPICVLVRSKLLYKSCNLLKALIICIKGKRHLDSTSVHHHLIFTYCVNWVMWLRKVDIDTLCIISQLCECY